MYVEAVYLQAESSQLPELKRVIVSYENSIAMEKTLDAALRKVFGGGSMPVMSETTPEGNTVMVSSNWQQLVSRATLEYQAAVDAQKAGDWSTYGEELGRLEDTLRTLTMTAEQPEVVAEQGTPAP